MSNSGTLLDIVKLQDVSKDVVSRMPGEHVYTVILEWAKQYDESLADLMQAHKEATVAFLAIDKDSAKPRKDFAKWSEVKEKIFYLYLEFLNSLNIKK